MLFSRQILKVITLILLLYANSFSQINVETLSSNLPLVIIDTDGRFIRDEPKVMARMGIIDNGPQSRNSINDSFNDYDGWIGIEIRGNSSQDYPKKSYGFETRLQDESNNNVRLLGMPRENDWVLYAPFADKGLMRNVLIFQLAREMGRYAPRSKFCELVINDQYKGIYVLMEKIKRDDDRVDIAKLDNDDTEGDSLTGGYLLKSDWAEWNEGWQSTYSNLSDYGYGGSMIIWVDPKPNELLNVQKEYIENYITEFEEALKSKNFRDPETGYYKYIDIDSFIDFMIGQELANNVDAYALSTFYYKKRDSNGGKLYAGPLWDFNFSFGNADYGGSQYTSTYSFNTYLDPAPMWWQRFLEDSIFTQRMSERWSSLRNAQFTDERIFFIVDSLSNLLNEAQLRNFERWDILGEYIWPNNFIGDTFEEEIDYLKDWLQRRLAFLDEDIPKLGNRYNIEDTAEEIEEESVQVANAINIYPNPASSVANIAFTQSRNGPVSLTIYNVLGQQISDIFIPFSEKGDHNITWQGRDINNREVTPGVYFAVMKLNYEVIFRRKLLIIR